MFEESGVRSTVVNPVQLSEKPPSGIFDILDSGDRSKDFKSVHPTINIPLKSVRLERGVRSGDINPLHPIRKSVRRYTLEDSGR